MKKRKINNIGKMIYLLLFMVFISLSSQAQVPAANINGPLKAIANGADITLTTVIAFGTENPTMTYSLQNNTSGATIVSKGHYTFDPSTDIGKQSVIINPGNTAGSFVVNLEVMTAKGKGECSKSVVVAAGSTGVKPNK
jgi:hypothetical protein